MAKIKNKQELISKIKNAEGFSNEEKSQMLALLNENKTYGLVWEKSTEDAWEMMKDYVPVLKEDESKRIDHGSENPNHILIEGDNLNALTALSYTHEGGFDMMYFDPPYNTGNGDFTYNDKIVDEEDTFRHSKWLSFMAKRLKIARKLLSDSGVIFISIDDYSQAQLKVLCDSIFDTSSNPKHSNFVTTLIWNKQHSQQQGLFKKYHEYVLVYAKNKSLLKNVLTEADGLIEAGAMKKISSKNPASTFAFPAGTKVEAPDGTTFSGTYGDSEKVTVVEGPFTVKDGKTVFPIVLSAGWTQKKQMDSWFKGQETYDTKGQKIVEFYFNSTGKIKCRKQRGAITPNTFLPEFGMGSEQTSHLEDIMGKPGTFTNPKPVEMIKLFIEWFCPKNGRILDIFAGSGTTLEATMLMNEDGGNRQCVLVTNNENNICEEVTYERNKRVIEGYTTPKGEFVEGLQDNNLRYFKVGFTPREKTDENMFRLAKNSVNLLRIKHDVYKKKQLGELENPYKRYRYFEEDGKQLLVILDTELIGDIVEQLEEMEVSKPIPTYVFSTGAYPFTEDFESVADKVELYPLPHCLYQACERNMPKMIDKEIENPEGISLSNEELETSMDDLTKEEA